MHFWGGQVVVSADCKRKAPHLPHTQEKPMQTPRTTINLYEPDWRSLQDLSRSTSTTPSEIVEKAVLELGEFPASIPLATAIDTPRIDSKLRLTKPALVALRLTAWRHGLRHADVVRAAVADVIPAPAVEGAAQS